jgi:hypothetical protein
MQEQSDPERFCTSIRRAQQLSAGMSNRRFTRLRNTFSKKRENHWATVAYGFASYIQRNPSERVRIHIV